jgi:hypothetical protein
MDDPPKNRTSRERKSKGLEPSAGRKDGKKYDFYVSWLVFIRNDLGQHQEAQGAGSREQVAGRKGIGKGNYCILKNVKCKMQNEKTQSA